jgi:hypothetical protein
MCRLILWQTQNSKSVAYILPLESCTEFPRRYLTLTYRPCTVLATPIHCGEYPTVFIFSFVFCNYTGHSSVSAVYYFSTFVLWTHIILWNNSVEMRERAVWRQFNSLQHFNKAFFDTRLQCAIQTAVIVQLNSTEHCSNGKLFLIFVDNFLQSQSQFCLQHCLTRTLNT